MSTLVAKHDKVILKKIESSNRVEGGFIIPDSGQDKTNMYEVISVGPGMYNPHLGDRYPMEYAAGDMILVPKAVVSQFMHEGEEYFVCREVEIQCLVIE